MAGGSILIAYESDWERAEDGLKALDTRTREEDKHIEGCQAAANGRYEDLAHDDEGDDEDTDVEADSDDDGDSNETDESGPLYVVKLIDFAHTRLKPGEGPDESVLVGLDTLVKLLNGRIEQVQNVTT